jgi:uncharacterized protein (DUF927 family)
MKDGNDPLGDAYPHDPGTAPPHERADGLPDGFRLRRDGVYRREEGKEGEPPDWVKLCSPIRVLALTRDRSGEGWGRLVAIADRDGREHLWAIPAELFAGDGLEVRKECLRLGLDLASGNKARLAFADLLMQWRPAARAITADRLGWADETCTAFVLGDGRVIGAEHVVYQHANAPAAAAEMKAAGTVEGWRAAVAALCAGNPLLVASVCLAFAGVLLEPLGLDGGGLHLRGASSRGKSTAQRAAVSVWGTPRFLVTWRATANGLEGVAAACNSTLLGLDEMGEVSGKEAGQAAYMLANGAGKARADRSGRARPVARWKVMILSSGEIGLADKVAEAGGKVAAGQMVRLLDIAADSFAHGAFADLHGAADGAAFADRVKAAAAEHYGTAGPAFVARFVALREEAATQARAAMRAFADLTAERLAISGGEGQTARAVARMGLIAAAGELATAWGLTCWRPGEARDAALEVLRLWLSGRGGGGPAEAREAIERTRAFLVAHGDARFEPVTKGADDRPLPNRAGWREGETYFIATDAWREIHKGADPARAARHVHAAGFLKGGDGRNLATRAPRSVAGRPRVYAVLADIMGAGDD